MTDSQDTSPAKQPETTKSLTPACLEAEAFANNLLMPELMVLKQCVRLAKAGIERREYPEWINGEYTHVEAIYKSEITKRLRELEVEL